MVHYMEMNVAKDKCLLYLFMSLYIFILSAGACGCWQFVFKSCSDLMKRLLTRAY